MPCNIKSAFVRQPNLQQKLMGIR